MNSLIIQQRSQQLPLHKQQGTHRQNRLLNVLTESIPECRESTPEPGKTTAKSETVSTEQGTGRPERETVTSGSERTKAEWETSAREKPVTEGITSEIDQSEVEGLADETEELEVEGVTAADRKPEPEGVTAGAGGTPPGIKKRPTRRTKSRGLKSLSGKPETGAITTGVGKPKMGSSPPANAWARQPSTAGTSAAQDVTVKPVKHVTTAAEKREDKKAPPGIEKPKAGNALPAFAWIKRPTTEDVTPAAGKDASGGVIVNHEKGLTSAAIKPEAGTVPPAMEKRKHKVDSPAIDWIKRPEIEGVTSADGKSTAGDVTIEPAKRVTTAAGKPAAEAVTARTGKPKPRNVAPGIDWIRRPRNESVTSATLKSTAEDVTTKPIKYMTTAVGKYEAETKTIGTEKPKPRGVPTESPWMTRPGIVGVTSAVEKPTSAGVPSGIKDHGEEGVTVRSDRPEFKGTTSPLGSTEPGDVATGTEKPKAKHVPAGIARMRRLQNEDVTSATRKPEAEGSSPEPEESRAKGGPSGTEKHGLDGLTPDAGKPETEGTPSGIASRGTAEIEGVTFAPGKGAPSGTQGAGAQGLTSESGKLGAEGASSEIAPRRTTGMEGVTFATGKDGRKGAPSGTQRARAEGLTSGAGKTQSESLPFVTREHETEGTKTGKGRGATSGTSLSRTAEIEGAIFADEKGGRAGPPFGTQEPGKEAVPAKATKPQPDGVPLETQEPEEERLTPEAEDDQYRIARRGTTGIEGSISTAGISTGKGASSGIENYLAENFTPKAGRPEIEAVPLETQGSAMEDMTPQVGEPKGERIPPSRSRGEGAQHVRHEPGAERLIPEAVPLETAVPAAEGAAEAERSEAEEPPQTWKGTKEIEADVIALGKGREGETPATEQPASEGLRHGAGE
ncbi:unnamed protein product, partial [Anisakis simplex]|uniref:HTH La-type RNA-binding domain-containing protein n=1 Tax=Anisakis simplex TaxID=6269 RepID=A0A0M3K690_ANISI